MMDVVITYLHGSLDSDIYIKLPKGFNISKMHNFGYRERYFINLNKSPYGLKQYRHISYNSLCEYFPREKYTNNSICPCIFIKIS